MLSFHNLPSEQFTSSRVTDRHHPPINPPYQGFNWQHEQKLCCFRKLNSVSEFHCDFDVYRYQGWVRHSNIVVDMCCWASTCAVDVIFPLSHDATHDTSEFHIHVLLVMEISFCVNILTKQIFKTLTLTCYHANVISWLWRLNWTLGGKSMPDVFSI